MGLDVSHDAFHGAYSSFNRLRQAVARAAGGSYPPHDPTNPVFLELEPGEKIDGDRWYVPDGMRRENWPGLYEFLSHSDCDGEIAPEMCAKVADDLERLLPALESLDLTELAWGHLVRGTGGPVERVREFIAGCRAAHKAGEPLEFA